MSTSDAERELRAALAALQREYQERAKPLIEQLAHIEGLKPPQPFFICAEQLGAAELERIRKDAASVMYVGIDPARDDEKGAVTAWRKLDGGRLELVSEMTHEEYIAAQDNGRAWPQADSE